jgi:hypothetical protein
VGGGRNVGRSAKSLSAPFSDRIPGWGPRAQLKATSSHGAVGRFFVCFPAILAPRRIRTYL